MNETAYRFKVGNIECIAVSDGTFAYPWPGQNVFINFFVNASQGELSLALREWGLKLDQWKQYVSPYICLVIDNGQHKVLVDTGAGSLAPTTGKLIPRLRAEGISPEDINTVILTHGHPDHIGGNLDCEGNPAFPDARYVLWKNEWDFWTSEPSLQELQIDDHGKETVVKVACENLFPLQDQLFLIHRETKITPQVRGIAAPGHTPGHMIVEVSSGGEKLIHISDTVLHPIHVERPDWYSSVAFHPQKLVENRHRLLKMASTENSLVLATHFQFPGLGHFEEKDAGWRWHPLKS